MEHHLYTRWQRPWLNKGRFWIKKPWLWGVGPFLPHWRASPSPSLCLWTGSWALDGINQWAPVLWPFVVWDHCLVPHAALAVVSPWSRFGLCHLVLSPGGRGSLDVLAVTRDQDPARWARKSCRLASCIRAFADSFNFFSCVLCLRLSVLVSACWHKAQYTAVVGYCPAFRGLAC